MSMLTYNNIAIALPILRDLFIYSYAPVVWSCLAYVVLLESRPLGSLLMQYRLQYWFMDYITKAMRTDCEFLV